MIKKNATLTLAIIQFLLLNKTFFLRNLFFLLATDFMYIPTPGNELT